MNSMYAVVGRTLMVWRKRTLAMTAAAIALALWLQVPALGQSTGERPSRIVSLVPAVTEMLFAVGAGDRVVGVSSFDRFPPEVERLQRVGALLDPDVERILSLRPDLVVVYRSQTDLLAQLARAKVPAFVYAHAGLADVTATLRQLGSRVGNADRANEVAADIERRIDAARKRGSRPRPKTLVVIGRDALSLRGIYASGGIGFIHDMLIAAGGDNVFADLKREAVQATTEQILASAPEAILELHADPMDDGMKAKELKVWAALASVPAVRNQRIYIIVDPRTVIPGPRVADAVEVLSAALRGR
jgi:iron complex transport system substrate-binding protein